MRSARYVLLALGMFGGLFAGVVLIALEGQEVVVLRTTRANGSIRETRVWIADEGEFAWVEAATTQRPFYRDLLENPHVEIERGGRPHAFVATVFPGRASHKKIRDLLRAKYGLADRIVGLLQDTSGSIAIRLAPVVGNREGFKARQPL